MLTLFNFHKAELRIGRFSDLFIQMGMVLFGKLSIVLSGIAVTKDEIISNAQSFIIALLPWCSA
ncbi:hypothetical protein BIY07_03355 [Mycoplasmoides pneumoniae]|nr:hypothetical protein BIY07_03355 [Mycoplasmoides pneumoniae]